jgi:hypothetical protein
MWWRGDEVHLHQVVFVGQPGRREDRSSALSVIAASIDAQSRKFTLITCALYNSPARSL